MPVCLPVYIHSSVSKERIPQSHLYNCNTTPAEASLPLLHITYGHHKLAPLLSICQPPTQADSPRNCKSHLPEKQVDITQTFSIMYFLREKSLSFFPSLQQISRCSLPSHLTVYPVNPTDFCLLNTLPHSWQNHSLQHQQEFPVNKLAKQVSKTRNHRLGKFRGKRS